MRTVMKSNNQEYNSYNKWKVGMKLEAVDRLNPHLTCVASVIKVAGNQVTITFDGWGSNYDYTTEASNADLHPIGYCQFTETDRSLQAPLSKVANMPTSIYILIFQGYEKEFDWVQYLKETNSVPVPYDLFTEVWLWLFGKYIYL